MNIVIACSSFLNFLKQNVVIFLLNLRPKTPPSPDFTKFTALSYRIGPLCRQQTALKEVFPLPRFKPVASTTRFLLNVPIVRNGTLFLWCPF